MRRLLLVAAAFLVAASSVPHHAYAQMGGGGDGQDEEDDAEAAKRQTRAEEWGDKQAPLPAMRNAGPCPFVKTLYDAARYVEFKDNKEASANVGFTGEIQGVSAACEYKSEEPITVKMEVLFELGRGPQADGRQKTYRYWVAVTDRNRSILAKETFDLPVSFKEGEDRVYIRESIDQIVIPRAELSTSGANFEILVGFEVTPEMAAFNRDGKRFRASVAGSVAQAGDAKSK